MKREILLSITMNLKYFKAKVFLSFPRRWESRKALDAGSSPARRVELFSCQVNRSPLKNRILVQAQGGVKFQPAGIPWYFEELKQEYLTETGTKRIFKIAYNLQFSPV